MSKMIALKTIKIYQSFFKSETITFGMLFDIFLLILAHISLVHFLQAE